MRDVTAVHMAANGTSHEHIESVRYNDDGGQTQTMTVASAVSFIKAGGTARVPGPPAAPIGVNKTASGREYIQTYADRTWTNNLLNQPRY